MPLLRAIVFFVLAAGSGLFNMALAQTAAEYPRVETSVEPTSGTVGDTFQLRVQATVPELSSLDVTPLFDVQSTWTLTGTEKPRDTKSGNLWTRTYVYNMVPFEIGRQDVPQVALSYAPAGGTTSTVHSEALWVQIDSVLSGDGSASALRDVKPPEALPIPKALVWSGALILSVLLAMIGWWVWRRYSMRLKKLLGRALTPPEVALKQIATLESERLIEQKKMKELYTRLTDIVRVYLAEAYGVHAMDLTSNELLDAMDRNAEAESPLHLDDYRKAMARLVEVLNEADMVKFARFMPEPSQCRRTIQAARDVVSFTRYKFEENEEEPDARKARERGRRGGSGRGQVTSSAGSYATSATGVTPVDREAAR